MDTPRTSATSETDTRNAVQQEAINAMVTMIGTLEHLRSEQRQLLNDMASNVERNVKRMMEDALPRLTQQSRQALSLALDPASAQFEQALKAAKLTLQQATDRYAQAQHALETMAMRRMWMVSIGMLVAGILGVCAGGCVLYSSRATLAELQQRRAEIAYLDRVARADLVPCGEDRLCAEVEKKGPRYGDHGQYRVIPLRQSAVH